MNDKNIHKDFLQNEELPATILPTAVAWKDMQQRLDKEQPYKGGLLVNDPGKDKAFRSRIVKGTALLLLLLLTWVALQQTNNKERGKNITQTASYKTAETSKKPGNDSLSAHAITNNTEIEKERKKDAVVNPSGTNNDLPGDDNKNTGILAAKKKNTKSSSISLNKKVNSVYSSKKNNQVANKTKKKSPVKIQSNAGEIEIVQDKPATKALLNEKEALSSIRKDVVKDSLSSANINNTDKKKQDSIQKNNIAATEPEPQEKKHKEIEWGFHWTLQLPTGSSGQYFNGPSAGSQPYRILLPGVWLNFRIGRSVFETEVNPFASAVLPAKSFGTFTTSATNVDTIITTTAIKTLRKMFGISGTIGYAYNISGNWWLGTSIQGYWWRKGIATTKGQEVKQVIGSSTQTKKTFSNVYSIPATEKNYFTKLQMINSLEMTYKIRSSQAMLRIGITPMPFSKKDGPANPFRAEFVYKLALFGKKKPGSGYTP